MLHLLRARIVFEGLVVLPHIWVFHKLYVVLHRLFFAHSFYGVPGVPLGPGFQVDGPRLAALDISLSRLDHRVQAII